MADSNSTPTVKPCVKCGATDRYKSGDCRPCHLARSKQMREKFPEKKAIADAKYWKENAPKLKEKSATWRKNNVEKKKAMDLAWRLANPERVKKNRADYYEKNKDVLREIGADWRAKNPDKVKEANVRSYKRNHLKIKAASAAWALANPEKIKAISAKFRINNPEDRIVWEHNRRARKRASGGKLSIDISEKLFQLQKGKCACCKQPLGDDYHLDHIMPLALGGTNTDDNAQLLRKECNLKKNAKHPIDFMQSRGFLL